MDEDAAVKQIFRGGAGAKVVFYSYVIEPSMCARTLVCEGRVYRHGHDRNAMLMCLSLPAAAAPRMFMRCFSCKCKGLRFPASRPAGVSSAWVEILESDLKSEAVVLAVAPADDDDKEGKTIIAYADGWDQIQSGRCRRGILAALGCSRAPPPAAADDREAVVVLSGSSPFGLLSGGGRAVVCGGDARLLSRWLPCPRQLQQTAAPAAAPAAAPQTIILVLESVERCSGACSYTLFIRCMCKACRTTYVDPWLQVAPDHRA